MTAEAQSQRPEPRRLQSGGDQANGEARAKPAEADNGNGGRRALDRLATLAVPVLLGALGVVLWSMLGGVIAGVDGNRTAIAGLQATVENLAATVNERTVDLWTGAQEQQQQLIQALVDTAQNDQLIEAKAELRDHRERLEAIAIELAVRGQRLEDVEAAVGTEE